MKEAFNYLGFDVQYYLNVTTAQLQNAMSKGTLTYNVSNVFQININLSKMGAPTVLWNQLQKEMPPSHMNCMTDHDRFGYNVIS